jgi:hypothetical protein
VHEDIFSRLALDKSEALRSIKPLYCSLFLHWPASHAQLRPGRSRRYWNCVASLGPFSEAAKDVLAEPPTIQKVIQEQQTLCKEYHKKRSMSTAPRRGPKS